MVLYFYNLLSSMQKDINLQFLSLSPSLTLNVLTYPLMSGNIKTNGLIAICKCPIKYLELVFVLINFNNYIINIKIRDFCWVSLAS